METDLISDASYQIRPSLGGARRHPAAANASKACDYLHSLENGKVKSEQPGAFTERLDAETQERQALSR
jgi:hypothetical protein